MLIKNNNIVLRTVHGSIFLIDISDNYSEDKCALYEINEIGKFLWNSLDSSTTVEELARTLEDAIVDDVPYDIIFNDVKEYIEDLCSHHFVWEEKSNG